MRVWPQRYLASFVLGAFSSARLLVQSSMEILPCEGRMAYTAVCSIELREVETWGSQQFYFNAARHNALHGSSICPD